MRVLKEGFVKQQVVKWLTSNRWGHIDYKQEAEHGVDIKARHVDYPRYYLIEAKGDPDPREVKNPQANRDVRFMLALGQILSRMNTDAYYYYGIAVPKSYESLVYGRVPWQVCRRLNLRFLMVGSDGRVDELGWKDVRQGRPSEAASQTSTKSSKVQMKRKSGWALLKLQMPTSDAVVTRLEIARRRRRSPNYIRTLQSLKRYWEKRGR